MALSSAHETESALLAEHLRVNAPRYFLQPDAAPAQVTLLRTERRAASCLHRFEVRLANQRYAVLIKTPKSPSQAPAHCDDARDRPRIAVVMDAQQRLAREYEALRYIHEYFSKLDESRFGAIRAFELLPERKAIVMEALDQHSLRLLAFQPGKLRAYLESREKEGERHAAYRYTEDDRPPCAYQDAGARRAHEGSGGRFDLRTAFEHAGAWLRAYHRLPAANTSALHTGRSDFVRYTEELSAYLARQLGNNSLLTAAASWTATQAPAHLPDSLPLALTHGDYAMRNILVDVAQRVTVVDALACYRAPIYRDIGCFIANLYCAAMPALVRGSLLYPTRVKRYRDAFLKGYFQNAAIPKEVISMYEVQALLERWSSVVRRCSIKRTSTRAVLQRGALPLLSAFFAAMIRARLAGAQGFPALRP